MNVRLSLMLMEREYIFMKNNISRHKDLIGFKIQESTSFSSKRISKHKTVPRPRSKFVSIMGKGYCITQGSKDF